jgi:uncharacterized Tic20 family protein
MNGTSTSANIRSWCVACHLSALAGFVAPAVGHVLGPLIVWLIKRGDSPEIDAHGKEALNFQISMLIYNLVAGILCLLLIGFALLAVLHILNVVFVIIAALKAGEGQMYRYPLTLRLIN